MLLNCSSELRPKILFVVHSHGGGTIRFASELAELIKDHVSVVWAWGVDETELHISSVGPYQTESRYDLGRGLGPPSRFLRSLGFCRANVFHTIGLRQTIAPLMERLCIPYDVTFTDYHHFSERPHFENEEGYFIGDDAVRAQQEVWRETGSPLLAGADRLIAVSGDLAHRIQGFVPDKPVIAARIFEAQSSLAPPPQKPDIRDGEAMRVLILGRPHPAKGLNVIVDVAKRIETEGAPIEIYCLGETNPILDVELQQFQCVTLLGAFEQDQLGEIVARLNPHLAWFPFTQPETHSYALSDVLNLGLPVLSTAIGAIPERLSGRPLTWLVPYHPAMADAHFAWLSKIRQSSYQVAPCWLDIGDRAPVDENFFPTSYLTEITNMPNARSRHSLPLPDPVESTAFRTKMTIRCRDCDVIPKVADAGKTLEIDGDVVQVMHNGVYVLKGQYGGGAWMSDVIEALQGHHEPQEELVFHHIQKLLPGDATMVELGCNWSYYPIWFLKNHPDRRAIGIEPDPAYVAAGARNAALNNVHFDISNGYIGSEDRPPAPFQTETSGMQDVPMRRASTICKDFASEGLDLLHLDIQGAEVTAIEDCEPLLSTGRIRYLVASTHAASISGDPLTHQKCLAMLERFGGRILAEHDVHESVSGDGLIAAYFGQEPIEWPDVQLSRNRYSTSLFRNPLFDVAELGTEVAELNAEVAALQQQLAASQDETEQLRRRAAGIEKERDRASASLTEISNSTIWRCTKPVRRLLGAAKHRIHGGLNKLSGR